MDRVESIEGSLRCFVYGLLALIPVLGMGLWFASGYFADLTLCGLAINRFFQHFRLAAAQGILRRN